VAAGISESIVKKVRGARGFQSVSWSCKLIFYTCWENKIRQEETAWNRPLPTLCSLRFHPFFWTHVAAFLFNKGNSGSTSRNFLDINKRRYFLRDKLNRSPGNQRFCFCRELTTVSSIDGLWGGGGAGGFAPRCLYHWMHLCYCYLRWLDVCDWDWIFGVVTLFFLKISVFAPWPLLPFWGARPPCYQYHWMHLC
jgi:hypothetical protein